MSQTITITATARDGAGKGVNRKLRAQGSIPAVVYGHHYKPISLSLNALEMDRMFRPGHEDMQDYQLYNLVIEGSDSPDAMVVIKDIQRHPVKDNIQHIDFFAVRMDEKIVATVHVRLLGKAIGVKNGGILRHLIHEIKVKSLPSDVPPHITIDVSEMEIGDSLHVKNLQVPENVQILTDADAGLVNVMAPIIVKDETEEGEEGEEGEEAAADADADAPADAPAEKDEAKK